MDDHVVSPPTASRSAVAKAAPLWPRRRLAWVAGIGSLLAVVAVARGITAPVLDPMWLGLGVVGALLVAVALATYVPPAGTGLRVELGCGPCAVVGLGLTAVSAWILVAGSVDGGNAAMSVVLAGLATAQRLSQPSTCRA